MSMRIKKGDMVKVIAGSDKGKSGKVVAVLPEQGMVRIEGLNIIKRAQKPNVLNPQGGIISKHQPIDVSKVAILHPTKKTATSRIGYIFKKDGTKVRVYTQANNKEIDT